MSASVLIVDDGSMARTLLRLMLTRSGFHVLEAKDGFDALEKVKTHHPDVVLLDVMMPGMDGFDVCAKLREDAATARLPVLMLSAKADLKSINRGLQVGADKYLTKPIDPKDLMAEIKDTLDDGRYRDTTLL